MCTIKGLPIKRVENYDISTEESFNKERIDCSAFF